MSEVHFLGLMPERLTLAENEWRYIAQVLDGCKGNVSHAARFLNIHRQTLQRKIRRRKQELAKR